MVSFTGTEEIFFRFESRSGVNRRRMAVQFAHGARIRRGFPFDVGKTHENEFPNSIHKSCLYDILHVDGVGPVKKLFRSGPEEDSG